MNDLQIRFDNFIKKLTERANELAKEVRSSVQDIYDEDTDEYKRSFSNFKAGIQGQLRGLITKADEVFQTQIEPHNPRYFMNITDPRWDAHNEWFRKIHDSFSDWRDYIQNLSNDIFKNVQKKSPEVALQEIIDEYNAVKDNFNCTQCGGKLEINEIYFISTYIPCPYCQTQNTFVPSSRMRELEFTAKDVAMQRTKVEEDFYNRLCDKRSSTSEERFIAYFWWRSAIFRIVSEIVPILADANKKVFYREMNDLLMYDEYNFDNKPELYRNIINLLTFKSLYEPQLQETSDEATRTELYRKWKSDLDLALGLLETIGNKGIPEAEFEKYLGEIVALKEKI